MVVDAGVPTHLASIWAAISEELGDETALVHGDRRVSWRDFDARAARFTSTLAAEGLTPGSVVAIDLYNCPESFEVFYAAIKAGFVPTMVNYRYREGEPEHLLDDAEAEVVVAHPELCEPVRAAAGRLPGLRRIVVVGEDYEELIESNPPWERPVDPEGGSMLSYTGGTTGLPKGVVYPMPRLARQALRTRGMVTGLDIDEEAPALEVVRDLRRGLLPVCCPASPLMHSTAFTFVSLPVLAAGGTIVTLENRRFDEDLLLDAYARHGVTATAVVGDAFTRPMVAALDRRAAAGQPFGGGTLRVMCSAGVAFSADTKRRLFEHLPGLCIVDGCGTTEGTTYGLSIVRAGDDLSTATFPRARGTIIVDEERQPVPDGVVGYISAIATASGYHRQPEKTAEVYYDDGEEHRAIPGDFGRIEPDGRLTLLGRGSTVINTGGEKVHPEEVEDAVKQLPGVVDVIVWAVPDERLGASVGAIVKREPDAGIDEDAVRDHVRRRLAGYKAPRVVVFVESIPRHPNGKLDTAEIDRVLTPDG